MHCGPGLQHHFSVLCSDQLLRTVVRAQNNYLCRAGRKLVAAAPLPSALTLPQSQLNLTQKDPLSLKSRPAHVSSTTARNGSACPSAQGAVVCHRIAPRTP